MLMLSGAALIGAIWLSSRDLPAPAEAARPAPGNSALPADAQLALREAQDDFTYQGKPIHPGMVNQFIGWLSDNGPITLAIDVRAGSGTDQYNDADVRQYENCVTCNLDRQIGRGASFIYERIGVLADKTQVLHTMEWGGGTGIFEDILFVRFRVQPHTTHEGKADYRLVMEVVSAHPIGDRYDGKLTLMNDRVIVGKSKHRDQDVVIHPTP
jgi:hypothetical protein